MPFCVDQCDLRQATSFLVRGAFVLSDAQSSAYSTVDRGSAAASPHRAQLRYSPEALRDPGTAGSEVVLVECSTHDVSSGRRGCVVATGCDDAFVAAPGSGPGLAVAPG